MGGGATEDTENTEGSVKLGDASCAGDAFCCILWHRMKGRVFSVTGEAPVLRGIFG